MDRLGNASTPGQFLQYWAPFAGVRKLAKSPTFWPKRITFDDLYSLIRLLSRPLFCYNTSIITFLGNKSTFSRKFHGMMGTDYDLLPPMQLQRDREVREDTIHNGEDIKHQVAKTDNSHVSEVSNHHWNYMMLLNLINSSDISVSDSEASHCSLIDFTIHWTNTSKRRRGRN